MWIRYILILVLIIVCSKLILLGLNLETKNNSTKQVVDIFQTESSSKITPLNSEEKSEPEISEFILPESKIIQNDYHIFQTFNNCGPAALSMALSYYNINKTQKELGETLRPYQVADGDNDDKSVTLEELALEAEKYGLTAFHRPSGSIELVKKFIANDIPVITRTRSTKNDDIGHYRLVKGYDDNTDEFIQDDSLQGHNLRYTYEDFNYLWKMFNYEYLVLVPKDKIQVAQKILEGKINKEVAWQVALENAEKDLDLNSDDTFARLNLSVALYNLGNYENSINEFELIKSKLPFRTLWYQLEPIKAYYQVGDYDTVLEMTTSILDNGNKAYSELYLIRGEIFEKSGEGEKAKLEFEKAIFYNKNYVEAKNKLGEE